MRVHCRALHRSHLLRTDPGEGVESPCTQEVTLNDGIK